MTAYRPDTCCPWCQRKPAIDIPDSERERAAEVAQNAVLLYYLCRGCGHRYPILARDFRDAHIVAATTSLDLARLGP